jgi:Polyketide cyclase / dehydrase and lipid transport
MAEPHTKFHAEAACAAPAREVWKLLYDPVRFARWWPGWERIEPGEGSALTRYDARWPDFAYPAIVSSDPSSGRVVVSCLLSDIVHTWSIDPGGSGCQISVVVTIPAAEADRTGDTADVVRQALSALVSVAESELETESRGRPLPPVL